MLRPLRCLAPSFARRKMSPNIIARFWAEASVLCKRRTTKMPSYLLMVTLLCSLFFTEITRVSVTGTRECFYREML